LKASGADKVISFFLEAGREGNGPFLSGAALSAALGISRTALWKKVNSLRRRGFVIEAERGKGYRLLAFPDLSAEGLRASVRGGLGSEAVFYPSVGSTNDAALELAANGAAHGTVVVADCQEKGRGRLGRAWASPAGVNIHMSVILRPGIPPRGAGLITLMAAVASAYAIEGRTGLDVKIKWPNDLMASDRKLGGILTEMRSEPGRVLYAVAGIGVNVNMRPSGFPPGIRDTATSVLKETGTRHGRTPLAAAILDALSEELEALGGGERPLAPGFWTDGGGCLQPSGGRSGWRPAGRASPALPGT
jgi:BirA family biotin operon repressor/biotin-[acetyl-CoA-carboxylase] ligase